MPTIASKSKERQAWLMWLTHGAFTVLMLCFVARFSVLPVWHYLLLISVPALSIAMIRSYYEHRPHAQPEQRTNPDRQEIRMRSIKTLLGRLLLALSLSVGPGAEIGG